MKIGWIGLGRMGLPMSRRLHAVGHSITAYVRNEAGQQRAVSAGYSYSSTIEGVVTGSDIVISSILDDTALLDIVNGPEGLASYLREGQAFIETSTVSPEASAAVATLLAERNVAYLRAPVSGSTATAEAGALTTLVSGPRAAFDQMQEIFAAFTSKQFYLGDQEQARFMKLSLNAMVGAIASLFAEALSISQRGGIDLATVLDVFCQSAVASPLLQYKRAMILEGHYDAAFSVAGMMKDFDLVLSVARSDHLPVPLVALIRQQYENAYLKGHGEKDFFVLIKEMADLAGHPR
jgi:3-hydroxyisobutyrate dehydrogenase-like beta-hydroxyacid dehydrogenase